MLIGGRCRPIRDLSLFVKGMSFFVWECVGVCGWMLSSLETLGKSKGLGHAKFADEAQASHAAPELVGLLVAYCFEGLDVDLEA